MIKSLKIYYEKFEEFQKSNIKNKNTNSKKYICEFDEKFQEFYIRDFDHSKFISFGKIRDSKLFLSIEEVDYLYEIDIIVVKEMTEEMIMKSLLNEKGLFNKVIYGYFRRSGSIICCAQNKIEINTDKMKNDYIVYKTNEDFLKENSFSYLRIIDEKKLSFERLSNHIKEIRLNTNHSEDCEILLVIIKNSNSFIFLNAKELIISLT